MRIVTVIPISRGIGKDSLTYFTNKDVHLGSVVSIPLRKKIVFGLVTESKNIDDVKTEIKSLPYSIKKIENIETYSFLSPEFIKSAEKIADFNAGSVGGVLNTLIPKTILEQSSKLFFTSSTKPSGVFYETLLLQADDEERYALYRSLIREEFAKEHSVFFCMPTTEDILNAKNILEKGIEKYTYILHGNISKKELLQIWKEITESKHPVLVIGTGSFFSLPIRNLGTIIVDKESSRAYKMQSRPFLDIRNVAQFFAKEAGVKIVFGDILLRVETLWREKKGEYTEISPLKFRSLSSAICEIGNMRMPQDMKKKEFSILGEEAKNIIKETLDNNENTFVLCGRKGMFPLTVCSDCGTTVVCKNCNAPVVLYSKKEKNMETKDQNKGNLFVCHHCGERRDAHELCVHCGGWRLNPMGIGTERVVDEIEKLFPNAKIFLMDKDNVKTHKQAVKIRDAFFDTPGGIMVGTEMALTYLNQKIENSLVVSVDSYFSIPDFQINEKVFHMLLELRALSEKRMLVQTRQEKVDIFDKALKGNLIDFYRDEIKDREMIGLPPFTTYIKISLEGEKNSVKKKMQELLEFFKPYNLNIFDAWNPGSKSKFTIHGLISLPQGKWVDKELLKKLKMLTPDFSVKIDPLTLL